MTDHQTDRAGEGAEEREAHLAKFRGAAPGLSERLAGDEGALDYRTYTCGVHGGPWKGDVRPQCPICAGDRADAIPEAAVEKAYRAFLEAKEVGTTRDALRAALRAAHPEAGSEEGERLRAAVECSVCATCGRRDNDFCSSAYHFALRAAHPEADRAPEERCGVCGMGPGQECEQAAALARFGAGRAEGETHHTKDPDQ